MFRFTIRDVLWLTVVVTAVGVALQIDHILWWQYHHEATRSLRKHIRVIEDGAEEMERKLSKHWFDDRLLKESPATPTDP